MANFCKRCGSGLANDSCPKCVEVVSQQQPASTPNVQTNSAGSGFALASVLCGSSSSFIFPMFRWIIPINPPFLIYGAIILIGIVGLILGIMSFNQTNRETIMRKVAIIGILCSSFELLFLVQILFPKFY